MAGTEPLTDDAGDELICSSIDAAVSSSGVHEGDTGGERALALESRRGGSARIRTDFIDSGDEG